MLRKNTNFRNLFLGGLFTNFGDSLVYIVFMWILYEITKNSLYTGIAAFFFSLPTVIGIFWGPVVDRFDNRKLLKRCALFSLIGLFLLLALTLVLGMNPLVILTFIPILAFSTELTYPIGENLLPKVVNRHDLTKANSLIMAASTGADLLFNAISAFILSFLAFEHLLLSMLFVMAGAYFFFRRVHYHHSRSEITEAEDEGSATYFQDLKEGLSFVKQPLVLLLLAPLVLLNIVYAIFYVALPEFVNLYFDQASIYGIILTLFGVGSLLGTMLSDYLSSKIKIGHLVSSCYFTAGVLWTLALVALQLRWFIFAAFFAVISSMANGVVNVTYAVLFQKLPDENMIGRVHTINMTLVCSAMPVASLLGGFLVEQFGSFQVILYSGLSLALISALVLLSKRFRKLPLVLELESVEHYN
ncbi:MFS transporter [Lactovum odontotermitis]